MIVSLVLSAVIVFVWFRSYAKGDSYHWANMRTSETQVAARRYGISTGIGGLGLYLENVQTADPNEIERLKLRIHANGQFRPIGYQSSYNPRYPIRWGTEDGMLTSLGLHWRHTVSQANGIYRRRVSAAVPLWLLFGLCAAYPLWRYISGVLERQREDREALGLCPRCGVPLKSDYQKCPGCDRVLAVPREA